MIDKELLKGCSKTLVLKLLSAKPMHGYEICRTLKENSGGLIEVTEGTLYPMLHKLEAEGCVEAQWLTPNGQRKRKVYNLTTKGEKVLSEKSQSWERFTEAVNSLMTAQRLSWEGLC